MEQPFAARTLAVLDHAAVLAFLSTAAEVLGGEVDARDVDLLRQALTRSHSGGGDDVAAGSLILRLLDEEPTFLAFLETRYGARGLGLNVLKYTAQQVVGDTVEVVQQWGRELLAMSELYFNRPIGVYVHERCETRTVASALLVGYADALAAVVGDLRRVYDALSAWTGHQLAGVEDGYDEALAAALGFARVDRQLLLGWQEKRALRLLGSALVNLAEASRDFASSVCVERSRGQEEQQLFAEELVAQAQRLQILPLQPFDQLASWELRRRALIELLVKANTVIVDLAEASLKVMRGLPGEQTSSDLAGDVRRRLSYELIAARVAPPKAQAAVIALVRYCQENRLRPQDLLEEELRRVDRCLGPETVRLLQEIGPVSQLRQVSTGVKTRVLKRAEELAKIFQQSSLAAGVLAVALAICTSCGVKTALRSEIVDYRPKLPFNHEKLDDPASPPIRETPPHEPSPVEPARGPVDRADHPL